jgi:subtilisin family serine protease
MRTNYKLIYAFMSGIIILFGCSVEDEEMKPQNSIRQSMESSAKAGQDGSNVKVMSDRYIIISSANTIPSELKSQMGSLKGNVTATMDEVGLATVTSSDPEFLVKASKMKGIGAVIRDFQIQWIDPSKEKGMKVQDTYGNPPASGDDDFFFDLQWGHDAIDAPEAWNAGYRGEGVRVAVLDTGFDLDHPDLAPNIDLGASKSFVPGEDLQYNLPDPFSHGTHVAGTIAAADNGFGIIGVAPEAELILLKVIGDGGSGDFSWLLEAIVHAVNEGADVINMSLGAYFPRNMDPQLVVAISRVTTYAYQRGATIISTAGNNAINGNKDRNYVTMPAEAPHVVSVSATAPRGWALDPFKAFLDYPASYTNYGTPEVDLAAPGGDYVYPGDEVVTIGPATAPAWVFDMVFSTGNNSWYWSAGTSMAAPHASGVAALIIGKNGGEMKPAQVESVLKRTAEDLGKPGRDPYYGHGRVNAYYAVTGKKVPTSPANKDKSVVKGKTSAKGKLVSR